MSGYLGYLFSVDGIEISHTDVNLHEVQQTEANVSYLLLS